MKRTLILVPLALALAACVATEAQSAINPAAPGFIYGVWHGFIFPVSFILSLFTDDIAVYAVPNNGTWYDFGYLLGAMMFLGGGGAGARK